MPSGHQSAKASGARAGAAENSWEIIFTRGWHPYAWIALIGFALYARTLFFGWTYLDDDHLVLLNYHRLSDLGNILLVPHLHRDPAHR